MNDIFEILLLILLVIWVLKPERHPATIELPTNPGIPNPFTDNKKVFERIIITYPPFDKRSSDPSKDYGIGSMEVLFILKGIKGATEFHLSTGSYLPHVIKRLNGNCGELQGYFLCYHSPHPRFDEQTATTKSCTYVEGGVCYCDGTFLGAEKPLQKYIQEGEEGLWKYLEKYYYDIFGE